MGANTQRIFEEIEATQKNNIEGLDELKALRIRQNRRIQDLKAYEAHKWEYFQKIIEGQRFFRFSHLYKTGIRFKIAIHLSAKNAGKTTEIYREMARIIERGEKFLYGRVYPQEMESAVFQFEVDELSPVLILRKERRWYFYKKSEVEFWRKNKTRSKSGEEDENTLIGYPRVVDMEKMGFKPVGLGYTFFNSNTLGGMNYEGYTTIFFDEILSYSPMNRINKRVLDAWDASVSTITRQKPNMRIFFLGNLLDVKEHPILKFYGVDVDDNLRVVKRGENGECTILFINSGGLYESTFRNQAEITKHGDLEHQAFLKNNKVIKSTPNVLNSKIFGQMDFECAFAMCMYPLAYFVEIRKVYDPDLGKIVRCLKCDNLELTTICKGPIYTDNPNIFNQFENTRRKLTIEGLFNHAFRLYRSKSLKFDSMASLDKYGQILNKHQSYIYDYGKR